MRYARANALLAALLVAAACGPAARPSFAARHRAAAAETRLRRVEAGIEDAFVATPGPDCPRVCELWQEMNELLADSCGEPERGPPDAICARWSDRLRALVPGVDEPCGCPPLAEEPVFR